MAATGFTPISLYLSTTAAATPSAGNLVAGELALNTTDEKLYFKNAGGTVKLLASNAIATFPSAGIANSTGTAWGTSYTTSGSGTVVALATSAALASPTITTIAETDTIAATAATGTLNYDVVTQAVQFFTANASGNWTLNFRGSSSVTLNTFMATGTSVSATFLVTQGTTAYYNSAVTIDGTSVTPKWQGGTAPTSGNASSIDCYTYVIQKTGSATYVVLASQTKFA